MSSTPDEILADLHCLPREDRPDALVLDVRATEALKRLTHQLHPGRNRAEQRGAWKRYRRDVPRNALTTR